MKKSIFSFITVAFLLFSCNNAELEQLRQENQQLKETVEQRNEDTQNLMQVFNEIEENLAEVRNREDKIIRTTGSSETGADRVEAIKNDIRAINELMNKNRETLKNLSRKLKLSESENQELQRMITNMKAMIDRKDQEILRLVKQLEELNFEVQDLYTSISELKLENAEQESIIDEQIKKMNTAYYVIGTARDLKKKEIITRKGGFIGIGRVEKLRQDFAQDDFTEIDIREKTVFPIDAKKAELVTVHPSDSYIMRKSEDGKHFVSFEITRPEEFWKSSSYMVLVVD